ncbi:hypothetical protein P3S68_032749 [Capsicum galapagoense]
MGLTNQDEDDVIIGAASTSILAAGVAIIVAYEHESSIPREPYVNKDQEREFYMNSILNGSDVHCVGQIRMSKHVFYELCNALRRNSFLCSTKNMSVMSIQEQVLIFLEIVGFNERFRKIGSYFYRLIESIHRCFHTVLQAVLKLYPILIKSLDRTIQPEIMNNHRIVPHGLQIPQDAGYGLRKGFIPPYHGIYNHLQEYSDCSPQNEKKLFHLRHASLRSSVERALAILKRRFRVIDNEHFWDFKTQVNVVLTSCILHNHIVDLELNDMIIQEVDVEAVVQP